jgi:hypothetical protein
MNNILLAIKIVYSSQMNIIMGAVVALVLATVYLFVGQVLVETSGIFFLDFDPIKVATFVTLSVLAGLVVPLEIFAIRKARLSIRSTGTAGMGLATGLATMSCCTPLILPSILAMFGWSVIQILEVNALIQHYLIYLSILSIAMLMVSLKLAADTVVSNCSVVRKEIE